MPATSAAAAAGGGPGAHALPGPWVAGTATSRSSFSAGTRMNRAVWYLIAVLPPLGAAGAARRRGALRAVAALHRVGGLIRRQLHPAIIAEPLSQHAGF